MTVKLLTRTRPKPLALPVVTKKLRMTSTNNAASRAINARAAKEEIDELLKSISEAHAEIDAATAKQDAACKIIEELLHENRIDSHGNGVYEAGIKESFTNQSRTVDPKKFKANVAAADFWKAIKVSIGEAEKIMTEKELNAISDVVPAKSNGHRFYLKKLDKKVKRG